MPEMTSFWLVSRLREQTTAQSQTSSIIQPRIINTVKPRPELVSDHTESPSIAVVCTCLCGRVSITRCERLCYVVGPPDKEDPEPIKATVGSAELRQNKGRVVCNCDNLWEVLTRSSKSQNKWTKVETQLLSTLGVKYAHTCCHLWCIYAYFGLLGTSTTMSRCVLCKTTCLLHLDDELKPTTSHKNMPVTLTYTHTSTRHARKKPQKVKFNQARA